MTYVKKLSLLFLNAFIALALLILVGFTFFRDTAPMETHDELSIKDCPEKRFDPTKSFYFTFENEPNKNAPAVRTKVFADKIVIAFRPETKKIQIDEIFARIKGCINKKIPRINAYWLQIPAVESEVEMQQVIDLLLSYPEVERAEPIPRLQ
jgi:hypothetical protein